MKAGKATFAFDVSRVIVFMYLKRSTLTSPFIFDVIVDYKDKHNSTLPQFIPYEDSIYNVIQKKVTWYEALKACSQSGRQLASVHDPNGKLFLEDIVNRDGFPLWVGLSSHDVSLIFLPEISQNCSFEN